MSPATEYHGSFLSRISIRRNQIVSMDVTHEQELDEIEDFQKHVTERLSELISPSSSSPPPSSSSVTTDSQSSDPILSIPWLMNLLEAFISCETEFKSVLTTTQISKSLTMTALPEMLDRILKALDICNAVVNGIDSVKQCQRLAEIVVTAFKRRPLCTGSVFRAKRALTSLLSGLNSGSGCSSRRTTSRSWSFGQRGNNITGDAQTLGSSRGGGYGCVSKNWSASKQIQAMVANLTPPRGPATPVYILSNVMVLVMWVLVTAVPCQTSSVLVAALPLAKHPSWSSAAVNIQERISEEIKRKEKLSNGCGLMEEIQRLEKIGLSLMEFVERFRFPVEEEEEEEVKEKVVEMEEICRKMEVGLEDLQRQVKEVFHRLVKTRIEIVSMLNQAQSI